MKIIIAKPVIKVTFEVCAKFLLPVIYNIICGTEYAAHSINAITEKPKNVLLVLYGVTPFCNFANCKTNTSMPQSDANSNTFSVIAANEE